MISQADASKAQEHEPVNRAARRCLLLKTTRRRKRASSCAPKP